jgi:hypothetical protein
MTSLTALEKLNQLRMATHVAVIAEKDGHGDESSKSDFHPCVPFSCTLGAIMFMGVATADSILVIAFANAFSTTRTP